MKKLVFYEPGVVSKEHKDVLRICKNVLGCPPDYNDRRVGGRRSYQWYTYPRMGIAHEGIFNLRRERIIDRLLAALASEGYTRVKVQGISWHSTGIRVTTAYMTNRYAAERKPLSSNVIGLVRNKQTPEGIIADALEQDGWPDELVAPLRSKNKKSLLKDLRELVKGLK